MESPKYHTISSDDIIEASDGTYIQRLPYAITIDQMKLLWFTSPSDYSEVVAPYNTIRFESITYTITPGNYSLSQLMTEITNETEFTVTFDNITQVVTHDAISTGQNPPLEHSLLTVLGLDEALSTRSVGVRPPQVLKRQIYLTIDGCTGMLVKDQLTSFVIPIRANRIGFVEYNEGIDFSQEYKLCSPRKVTEFRLRFHHRGEKIDMPHWTIVLRVN